MKQFNITLILAIGILLIISNCTSKNNTQAIQGDYLGQQPPGEEGVLFAPGIMSTGLYELNAAFFPGGKEVIYSVQTGQMQWTMVMIKEVDGEWTHPEIASFSGKFGGVDPFVSYDGNTIYFCSNRPRDAKGKAEPDYDIWYVTRVNNTWTEPVNMGEPINSTAHDFYPSLAKNGTFYFQSRREGGLGRSDIYFSKLIDGKYTEAELLPKPINSPVGEGDALIAPDESWIIVSTYRAEEHYGVSDLYISFKQADGSWGEMKNMGNKINSSGGENCQILSPCGNYLFYTSRQYKDLLSNPNLSYKDITEDWTKPQNGGGDIYWVDANVIEKLRN